jgi:hypothetical protein
MSKQKFFEGIEKTKFFYNNMVLNYATYFINCTDELEGKYDIPKVFKDELWYFYYDFEKDIKKQLNKVKKWYFEDWYPSKYKNFKEEDFDKFIKELLTYKQFLKLLKKNEKN